MNTWSYMTRAPAGTKRLSRLLHSERWHWKLIERFLWEQADQQREALQPKGEEALVVWDESILEKSESLKLEGLGPVRSTKAARLKRIRPGYYNPPGGRPIFVPGWHWLSVLLTGMKEAPSVVTMRWWTNRGNGPRRCARLNERYWPPLATGGARWWCMSGIGASPARPD